MSYSELDVCLGGNYGADNWADNVSEYAQEIISEFSADDWNELENSFSNRSAQWKNYLAQILPWGNQERAVPILISLLSGNNEETIVSAADSLRDISQNNRPVIIDNETVNGLQKIIISTKSSISANAISAFLSSAVIKGCQ